MVASLGGPAVPAIGFAMGFERILLALEHPPARAGCDCYLAPRGEAATLTALSLARDLRAQGVAAEVDGRGNSMKSMLRRADSLGSRVCLIVGESELARGVVQLKDLAEHQQRDVELGSAPQVVAELLSAARPSDSSHGDVA